MSILEKGNFVLNEGQIKTAVIDRLLASGALEDAVLINEMVIANWSRRVDLAVANGHLHAFEIKSDLDTLRRLPGQLATYLDRFDKVTIVTTRRFARSIMDTVDERVEIWEASEGPEGIALKVLRRGRGLDVTNRRILIVADVAQRFEHKFRMKKPTTKVGFFTFCDNNFSLT